MTQLDDAVLRALKRAGAEIERVALEVRIGDRRELVSVAANEGSLVVVSSDGSREGPFALAALEALAGAEPPEREAETSVARPSTVPRPRPFAPLADALDELLTAVARAGIGNAASAAAVEEAIEQVLRTAPTPTPLGLARVIGRLRNALAQKELDITARVLEGSARLARQLRHESGGRDDATRIAAWLDQPEGREHVEQVQDRAFFEVAREWVTGTERAAIQRRYLVCIKSGEIFCEERGRHTTASIGPSPRHLMIGLGEIRRGTVPRRIRLLQYEVASELGNGLVQVEEVAETRFDRLLEMYRKALLSYPALAEPVVVVKARLHTGGYVLRDAADRAMRLVGDEALLQRVSQVTATGEVRWVAGKLLDTQGTLVLEPLSIAMRRGSGMVFERLQ